MPAPAPSAAVPPLRWLRLLGLVLGLLALAPRAGAHGDEPHAEASGPAVRQGAAVASALSADFEAVLVVPVRAPAEPFHATLYLADFATNAPLPGATLALTLPGRRDTFTVAATDDPGVYVVEGPALPAGALSFALRVGAAERRGLLLLSVPAAPAETGAAGAGADRSGAGPADASGRAPVPWGWLAAVAAVGVAGAVWLVLLARRRRQGAAPPASSSP